MKEELRGMVSQRSSSTDSSGSSDSSNSSSGSSSSSCGSSGSSSDGKQCSLTKRNGLIVVAISYLLVCIKWEAQGNLISLLSYHVVRGDMKHAVNLKLTLKNVILISSTQSFGASNGITCQL